MKQKNIKAMNYILFSICIFMASNFYVLKELTGVFWLFIAAYVLINIFPVFILPRTKRLVTCAKGTGLLIEFLGSTLLSVILFILSFTKLLLVDNMFTSPKLWVVNTLFAILFEATVFWNGMLRVFFSSEQLGVKIRIKALICGLIPIVHLFVLKLIIKTVSNEIEFENNKIIIDEARRNDKICATKYPILMVHGVFFRDFKYLNYWGRIPAALENNGAKIFYGNHQSAASVADCGRELSERVLKIIEETGCDKVNIIAHSKGGLDCRSMLSNIDGISGHVASLTTINTPHRGCEFADYLLSKVPDSQKELVAATYNSTLKRLGDFKPDFIAAVTDLTAGACKSFNENTPDACGVYYQSIGSKLNKAGGGRFPLNYTYHLANYFDGANDGLVGEGSFKWGSDFKLLTVKGNRGISHGDMIDLNRENIPEFDVREFYVQLVADLKKRGF